MADTQSLLDDANRKHIWRPLGLRGTLRFFNPLRRERRVASWRHFGWELEIEFGSGVHVDWWRQSRGR